MDARQLPASCDIDKHKNNQRKRGGRQAVLAAGIAPPRQDRGTLPCNIIVSGASPAGAADSSLPGYEALGHWSVVPGPQDAPFVYPSLET